SGQRSEIVKGIAHVDADLVDQLAFRPFNAVDFDAVSQRLLAQVPYRDESYALWQVTGEYHDIAQPLVKLDTRDLKVRTVYTLHNPLAQLLRAFGGSVCAVLGYLLYRTTLRVILGLASGGSIDAILSTALTGALLYALVANAWKAYPVLRALLVDQLPDAILLDVGRALLAALQESRLVSQTLPADGIRVVTQPNGTSEVRLAGGGAAPRPRCPHAAR